MPTTSPSPFFLPCPSLPYKPTRRTRPQVSATSQSPGRLAGKKILVTGATGPTGRLICGALSNRGAQVHAFIRPRTYMQDRRRVDAISELCPQVRFAVGDLRDVDTIMRAVRGCDGVISASGTRNFDGIDPNRPEIVDWQGIRLLVDTFLEEQMALELRRALSDEEEEQRGIGETEEEFKIAQSPVMANGGVRPLSQFVLVSSLGVTRPDRFPQLEQFGSMLSYKRCGEDAVRESGCPFTIVRPGGFKDGPSGENALVMDQGDRVTGTISRADVAEICAEAIFRESATNVTFECVARPPMPGMTEAEEEKGFRAGMFDELVPDIL